MRSLRNSNHDEVRHMLTMTGGDRLKAFELVQSQMSILVLRTQVMLSLSGIVVTVTGFSGRNIAQTSITARTLIALGLFIVLSAAVTAIIGVLKLKWLTQEISDDAAETISRMLAIRDRKARFLSISLGLFVTGFACYCCAIALMLFHTAPMG